MIADYDGDISNLLNTEITGEIPVLTTRIKRAIGEIFR